MNARIFKTKYFGPTNYKGSRVQITDERNHTTIMIPYNHEYNNAQDIARAHLEALGFDDLIGAEGKDCMYLITRNFTTPIK